MNLMNPRRRSTGTWPALLAAGSLLCLLAAGPASAQGREPRAPAQPEPCQGRGSIAGSLRDSSGAPVAGADVVAYGADDTPYMTLSEADGRYRLERACAGDYLVLAYRDGMPPLYGFHDVDADGEPDAVSLPADDTALAGIDIVLSAAEVVIGPGPQPATCSAPEGRISGRLLDAEGRGIGGAEVQVYGESGFASATSQADGSYTAEGLCAGAYLAFAWDQDPDQPRMGFYTVEEDLEPDEVQLAADDAAVSGIDIVLRPAEEAVVAPEPTVCEQPAFEARGTVYGKDGQPLADAAVVAFAEDGSYAEGRSGADGRYRLGLCAGSYVAVAYKELDPSKVQVGFYDPNSDGEPDRFALNAEHPSADGIDILMTMEDRPAARTERMAGLRRLVSPTDGHSDRFLRLTGEPVQPRRPITVEPVRPGID